MKVTLINPPRLDKKSNYHAAVSIPLGICYLASHLRANQIDVKIVDALGLGLKNVRHYDDSFDYVGLEFNALRSRIEDPDIIGISAIFSVQQCLLLELVEYIRREFPNRILVMGGNEATINYELYLDKGVDYVVLGEGEDALLKLVQSIKNKERPPKVHSLAFRYDGKLVLNEREFIENLDSLPFPAREMVPLENYWNAKSSHGPTNNRSTPITTSRGCPFDCSFCSSSQFWTRTWRKRSVGNVIEEMAHCIGELGIAEFEFEDDNLTLETERAKELFREIIRRKLRIKWTTPNGVRSDLVDEEMIDLMKESGCAYLAFAPESGSKRILKGIYNKTIDIDRIPRLVEQCNRIGIKTCCFIVVGTPSENEQDREATKKYIIELAKKGADEVGIFPCAPYPGTRIRAVYEKYVDHIEERELIHGQLPEWYPNHDEVTKYVSGLYRAFLWHKYAYHPWKGLASARNVISNQQELKMERILLRRLGMIKSLLRV